MHSLGMHTQSAERQPLHLTYLLVAFILLPNVTGPFKSDGGHLGGHRISPGVHHMPRSIYRVRMIPCEKENTLFRPLSTGNLHLGPPRKPKMLHQRGGLCGISVVPVLLGGGGRCKLPV
ncbi:hypothetical protein GGS20DRAFT_123411 [Poronia punctata]|nr:hypothetical protein GGS20DRAFT_123411 [Poronia punctata]